ncbi:hypothetical protein [Frankia sp. QA3]|uniref:hypothetical protein n=1 Tax=Frankia sp. QA3 TaxID=710111 RepID=UPI000269C20C|nr:hypothetical protein [Frankia sp. QA3]EIV92132.1 hypothetical protein FraQA3DRAFT_1643 [Frankia sp. QA3]
MKPADFFDVPEQPSWATLDDDPFDIGHQMEPIFSEARVEALRAVLRRLAPPFEVPFRDFSSFRTYWIKNEMSGSWAARREYLETIFGPLRARLLRMEEARLEDQLATPISPRSATGWPDVDREIQELRRHFHLASAPQDYRGIGTDCVDVLIALGRTVYDPQRHLRPGETVPPPDKTKQRLGRFIEGALPGTGNADLRGLATKTSELAHHVKHNTTPTRREAGIAADAVILLVNMLRRLGDRPDRSSLAPTAARIFLDPRTGSTGPTSWSSRTSPGCGCARRRPAGCAWRSCARCCAVRVATSHPAAPAHAGEPRVESGVQHGPGPTCTSSSTTPFPRTTGKPADQVGVLRARRKTSGRASRVRSPVNP